MEALETAAADTDDFLVWVLVLSELAAFGILIAAFLLAAVRDPESFALARLHLSPGLATANTLLLLTSGWQAAMAARRHATVRQQRRALVFAALLGFVFTIIKLVEFNSEMRFAASASFNAFFELYFIITGFHVIHVVFGAMVLLLVAWRPGNSNIALITALWHMIDLIWIVMFPIIYLV
ncbi:NorE accessory protein for nitric oxide reductase [Phyllobacterium brassicacearum]|uniref:NorE accessory protein for nitric oxide reductase n=1 Tax=Phyllobacterium brassicacearum TaxID=314235 RepID=A0A2P7B684_9HYPH|nr:cytochrome c oxidase subunit 3 [Phyllobacterium brassicacearum]PSH61987.1 NorE accessory protein for nitric oxide reductase [Phyllobacterium brassicacearum]